MDPCPAAPRRPDRPTRDEPESRGLPPRPQRWPGHLACLRLCGSFSSDGPHVQRKMTSCGVAAPIGWPKGPLRATRKQPYASAGWDRLDRNDRWTPCPAGPLDISAQDGRYVRMDARTSAPAAGPVSGWRGCCSYPRCQTSSRRIARTDYGTIQEHSLPVKRTPDIPSVWRSRVSRGFAALQPLSWHGRGARKGSACAEPWRS